MALTLFGYTLSKKEDPQPSFIAPSNDDGAVTSTTAGYFGTFVDMDATSKSEAELITRYREASMYSDCSTAIDEIVTEAIAAVDDEPPVDIVLDDVDLPDDLKNLVINEFDNVLKLLEFNSKAYDIFRRWYIDGRIYYQKVIDLQNPKRGILEVRNIDPRKIKKVRDTKKEKLKNGVEIIKSVEDYFLYNDKGLLQTNTFMSTTTTNQAIKIAVDSVTYVSSGLMDLEKNVVLSYLHKAIKPVNQLKMMEDALVIYRISRAPERRIFYIDVGNLPKIKAEQYLKDIMTKFRNKLTYDSATGEIRDDRKFMSMLEDFWLPRREGGRGTEISTLPGGENLGQIEDINYFQNKLYQALNVPLSRMQQQSGGFNFGREAEISRDELKFAKFVGRLRKKFSELFNDMLKTQLILKGVITSADWDSFKDKINYRFAQDQRFSELKDADEMRNRVDLLNQMQPYVGMYFSKEYIMKRVLRMSDKDIENMTNQIQGEGPPTNAHGEPINIGDPTDNQEQQ
jgi:hypothetical protein